MKANKLRSSGARIQRDPPLSPEGIHGDLKGLTRQQRRGAWPKAGRVKRSAVKELAGGREEVGGRVHRKKLGSNESLPSGPPPPRRHETILLNSPSPTGLDSVGLEAMSVTDGSVKELSPFLDTSRWINENETAVALRDAFPVAPGHTLIVPKRVTASPFALSDREFQDCWTLLKEEMRRLQEEFSPSGFNVGINVGAAAGQTVDHVHIHLIPRYAGDHPSPRGGVRAVIPSKADY